MSELPTGKKVPSGKRFRVSRKKSNDRVTRYLVILFAAAFFLLLLAMLMQHRANQATIDDLTESMASIHSLQNMVEVNQTLREENDTLQRQTEHLEEELAQSRAELETAQKSLEAMDYFRRIQMFYSKGAYSSARIVADAMEEADLSQYLPGDTYYQNSNSSLLSPAEEYARIREVLY